MLSLFRKADIELVEAIWSCLIHWLRKNQCARARTYWFPVFSVLLLLNGSVIELATYLPAIASDHSYSEPVKGVQGNPSILPPSIPANSDHGMSTVPAYIVPEELSGKTEIVSKRTIDSAHFDMGDGTFALMQTTHPIHYQNREGSWQKINLALEQVENGWINTTNLLQTSVALNNSSAKILVGSTGVGWEPVELAVHSNSQIAESISQPVPDVAARARVSTDGRSVQYMQGWSSQILQDQWTIVPGGAEYTMQLDSLPKTTVDEPEILELVVKLHLSPGTTVQLGGQPVQFPLETDKALTFVEESGEKVFLRPPYTYEQKNLNSGTSGTYLLTETADPSVVELRVRTPWQWLSEPERNFPVIIDPLFQVSSPTTTKQAFSPNEGDEKGSFDKVVSYSSLDLGQFDNGVVRPLIHFDLPPLPQGTSITKAYLAVTPTDVGFLYKDYLTANVLAYRLTGLGWMNFSPPVYDPTPLPPGKQRMQYSAGEKINEATIWDVTSLAQEWIASPASNSGIMLRTENEFCKASAKRHCGGFRFTQPSSWEFPEELRATEDNSRPDAPFVQPSIGGGIRLLVFYSGPTLQENGPEIVRPLPQSDTEPYYGADHEYLIPPVPSDRWQAVVTRGFGPESGPIPPEEPTVKNPYLRPLKGGLSIDLKNENGNKLISATPAKNSTNLVLLNGRKQSDQAYKVDIRTVSGEQPENYDVRLLSEIGSLETNLETTNTIETAVDFSSREPLVLWNVELPVGSNSRIDIQSLRSSGGDNSLGDSFSGWLINDQAEYSNTDSSGIQLEGGLSGSRMFGYLQSVQTETHALVVAYNGPFANYIPTSEAGLLSAQSIETNAAAENLTFKIRVRVTSCESGNYPTSEGNCQRVVCPDLELNTDTNFREGKGLGLWNSGGWTRVRDSNGNPLEKAVTNDIAPLIGLGAESPHIALVGGSISYFESDEFLIVDGTAMLIDCSSRSEIEPFPVFDGTMSGVEEDEQPLIIPWRRGILLVSPGTDSYGNSYIDPGEGKIIQQYSSAEPVGNDSKSLTQPRFAISWSLDFRGWSSLEQSVVLEEGALPSIAGLRLDTDNDFQLDLSLPNSIDGSVEFTAIRASNTTVSQPPELGGASKPVQVLILPSGEAIDGDSPQFCPERCIDLRAQDDTPQSPSRMWSMPDIHTNVAAGTVLMSSEGEMLAFSSDHPASSAQSLPKEFSFDAFNTTVSVEQKKCHPDDAETVTVISGEGQITIPNIGAGGDALIDASFILCQTLPEKIAAPDSPPSLRKVHLAFSSSVGVPLGNSGLFVTGLRGTVDIAPTYTTITVGLDLQAAQGSSGGVLKGHGEVTIDTRGLFAFQGSSKVLGTVDGNGELWVAWNPLDIGFELEVSYKDWLTGTARAHMWKGRGWQNRYAWLPDNNETHITAQIEATLKIKEGAMFDWWFIEIPPSDTSFEIEVAFGQFCTNSSCTTYEWGIKGKVAVAGYDIGVYYAFDHGFDFILGNDDYVLIDQNDGADVSPVVASMLGERIAQTQVLTAPLVIDGVSTIPITVTSEAENILFAVGWELGSPQLSLVSPQGVEITEINAAEHNAEFISEANSTIVGIMEPAAGAWQVKISNLSATNIENYKFVYFANKGAPGEVDYRGEFLAPIEENESGGDRYTIRWAVPAETPPSSTISLFATHVDGSYVGNLGQDVPVVQNLPFTDGEYVWDTSGLRNGTYQIHAIVDDGINMLPSFGRPDNACMPIQNELPLEQAFSPERFPGTSRFAAAGTVQILDTTPPETPTGLSLTAIDGAALAQWNSVSSDDVAYYLVRWGPRNSDGTFTTQNEQLITASTPRLRVGGLTNDVDYSASVQAIDVNNNASAFSPSVTVAPSAAGIGLPSVPISFTLASVNSTSATFTWNSSSPSTASYRLVYTELTSAVSPVQKEIRSDEEEVMLNDLRTGATYEAFVTALTRMGWESSSTEPIRFTVTSNNDVDNDGLPDDWAGYHGISSADEDHDADGLLNIEELQAGTDPTSQDSDIDDFSDGEEVAAGTDPYSNVSYPADFTQPRLNLTDDEVVFHLRLPFPITEQSPTKDITWENEGGGDLQLQATTDAPWIFTQIIDNKVRIGLDETIMEQGFYSGVVQLHSLPENAPLIGESNCVRVTAWVSEKAYTALPDEGEPEPPESPKLFLPLISG